MIQTPEAAPEADGEACGQHSRGRGRGPGDADRLDQVTCHDITHVACVNCSTVNMVTHSSSKNESLRLFILDFRYPPCVHA